MNGHQVPEGGHSKKGKQGRAGKVTQGSSLAHAAGRAPRCARTFEAEPNSPLLRSTLTAMPNRRCCRRLTTICCSAARCTRTASSSTPGSARGSSRRLARSRARDSVCTTPRANKHAECGVGGAFCLCACVCVCELVTSVQLWAPECACACVQGPRGAPWAWQRLPDPGIASLAGASRQEISHTGELFDNCTKHITREPGPNTSQREHITREHITSTSQREHITREHITREPGHWKHPLHTLLYRKPHN